MICTIQCTECKAQCTVRNCHSEVGNGVWINDEVEWEWGRGEWPECEHEDFDVIDCEYESFPDDV